MNVHYAFIAAVLFAASVTNAGSATPPAAADITPLLRTILHKYHDAPAVWGAIVDRGNLVAIGAVGVRRVGDATPVSIADQIHLGSDTKAMTALLIAQQVQQHRLSFTSTMGEIFADQRSRMDPAMSRVTIAMLLQHTAGLPHDLPWQQFARSGAALPAQRIDAVTQALSAQPKSIPGSRYSYSNVGYVILGAVLERITHQPWEQLIQRNIFAPLKMTTAGFGPPGTGGKLDQPWGHVLDGNALRAVQIDNPLVMAPAGGVHCSIGDWAKFVVQIAGPAPGATRLLESATLDQLLTPAADMDYAGGWLIASQPWSNGPALTHAGSNTTWFCVAWIARNRQWAFLAATNTGAPDASETCNDVILALLKYRQQQ